MKYQIKYSKEFKKGLKKLQNDQKSIDLAKSIIKRLANDESLEPKYKDHKLTGDYLGFRECHLRPNLLLIYKKQEQILLLTCIALGSHSELF
ncbi:type II toxin-antitoxin system YafQ family toxin [Campylobacter troglodytis]|uniref:type II toxin-antitoxin system YafQ family toxin n=1 Tax=Campylobacter troglodytis TaxID=654363 RepID=UPI001156C7B8|nr:type II toxin-antitoxin system YafQ family toxin [Campylobacter troglodytis]TQR61566.1 type II toxin-antitoxin system YafQ family toxin [Campylobacter troglodytis]